MKKLLKIICLPPVTVLLVFSSCKKETEIYMTTQESSTETPVTNATVKLFGSYEAWLNNNSEMYTFTSDANGKIDTKEKISTGSYWVWAENENYSSWTGTPGQPEIVQFSLEKGGSIKEIIKMYETYHSALDNSRWDFVDYVNSSGDSFSGIMDECFKDDYIEIKRDLTFHMNSGDDICEEYNQTEDLDIKIQKSSTDEVELVYFGNCQKINTNQYTDADGFSWNFYLQTENVSVPRIIMSNDTSAVLNFIFEKQ